PGRYAGPASTARSTRTCCRSSTRSATTVRACFVNKRSAVATWSLRLRPVCNFAPAGPAISVTRRSIAVWMSSSVGTNAKVPASSSPATWSSAARIDSASASSTMPARASPRTWARDPARSSAARRRSKRRLSVNSSSSGAGPCSKRPCQSVLARSCSAIAGGRGWRTLAGRPGLEPEAPQTNEAGGVLVAEGVGRVVGGEAVVVQAVVAAAPGHLTRAGFEVEAHLAGDEPLRLLDERVECLAQRREPQPVVHQLRVADLQPLLLARQVTFVRDRLEVAVRSDQRES